MEFTFSTNSQLIVSFIQWNSLSRIIHSYRIFLTMKFNLLNNSHLTIFLTMEFTLSNNSQLSNLSDDVIYIIEQFTAIVSFKRWNSLSLIPHSYRTFLKMEFTFSDNSQLSYLSHDGIYFIE